MIARFDHKPMLTALLALSTTVLLAVVITLSTLLITSPQAAIPESHGGNGNPGAAAAPANVDAGGENYGEGWNNYGHDLVAPKTAQTGDSKESDSAERQEVGHP